MYDFTYLSILYMEVVIITWIIVKVREWFVCFLAIPNIKKLVNFQYEK